MVRILEALYKSGFDGYIRPDHGRMIWGESGRPRYGLFDMALGAAYVSGIWETAEKNQRTIGVNDYPFDCIRNIKKDSKGILFYISRITCFACYCLRLHLLSA